MLKCPFCLNSNGFFSDITPNTEINSYLRNLPYAKLSNLLSRDCKKCPKCHSIFYWPLITDSEKNQLYCVESTSHHNVGWSRFTQCLDYHTPSISHEAYITTNVINKFKQNPSFEFYAELNCPFQGIVALHKHNNSSLLDSLLPCKRALITLPSTQMWSENCYSSEHESFCRTLSLSSGLFHDCYSLYSIKLLHSIKNPSTASLYLPSCLDHLDDLDLHLKYISSLFNSIIVRLHPYHSDLGPTMQHVMSIGDNLSVWNKVFGGSVKISDISSDFSRYTNDRFIFIQCF